VDAPLPHNPPLLFQIEWDPSERFQLDVTVPRYAAALAQIQAAAAAHRATVPLMYSQCSVNDPSYALCGDPASKAKYPQYPNCTLSPQNWAPPNFCNYSELQPGLLDAQPW
jgi:arylsulfatase A